MLTFDEQDWTEWDYRAFMEKRRRHEQQYADFVRRQNTVGQHEYLNISPMNDHRFLSNYIDQTGELPGRATHEEFMNVRTTLSGHSFGSFTVLSKAVVGASIDGLPTAPPKSVSLGNPTKVYGTYHFTRVHVWPAADHQQWSLGASKCGEHPRAGSFGKVRLVSGGGALCSRDRGVPQRIGPLSEQRC